MKTVFHHYCKQIYLLTILGCLSASSAFAAYSCNVAVDSAGDFFSFLSNADTNETLTLNCTRSSGDANTLTYRIKADNGLNANGTQRRVRLGSSSSYLNYYLNRGTTVGGTASCASSTNWQAPATGTTNVITGTLSFGSNLSASAIWGYCIRVSGFALPSSGLYTDTVQVFAQYPNADAGVLTASAALNYSLGVGNQCMFKSFPSTINFAYTSFSDADQTSSQTFDLQCSNSLPWSISVNPANNTLLGLNYSFSLTPSSGTGTGLNQTITLNGTVPNGQAGTCPNAVCTATYTHNIVITY